MLVWNASTFRHEHILDLLAAHHLKTELQFERDIPALSPNIPLNSRLTKRDPESWITHGH